MSRLVLTLVCVLLFATLALTASTDYGIWERPGPATEDTPSFLGITGLLITPTAMIAPALKVQVFYHQISSDPKEQTLYGATVGLTDGLEVSGLRMLNLAPLPAAPGQYRDETVVNVKYQVPLGQILGNPLAPEVAVGVFDTGNQVDRTYFVVLSRSASLMAEESAALSFHLGYGNTDSGSGRLDGFFAGVDFAPFENALVQLEYDADDVNAGLRYYATPWISLDAAIVADDFAWGATLRSDF